MGSEVLDLDNKEKTDYTKTGIDIIPDWVKNLVKNALGRISNEVLSKSQVDYNSQINNQNLNLNSLERRYTYNSTPSASKTINLETLIGFEISEDSYDIISSGIIGKAEKGVEGNIQYNAKFDQNKVIARNSDIIVVKIKKGDNSKTITISIKDIVLLEDTKLSILQSIRNLEEITLDNNNRPIIDGEIRFKWKEYFGEISSKIFLRRISGSTYGDFFVEGDDLVYKPENPDSFQGDTITAGVVNKLNNKEGTQIYIKIKNSGSSVNNLDSRIDNDNSTSEGFFANLKNNLFLKYTQSTVGRVLELVNYNRHNTNKERLEDQFTQDEYEKALIDDCVNSVVDDNDENNDFARSAEIMGAENTSYKEHLITRDHSINWKEYLDIYGYRSDGVMSKDMDIGIKINPNKESEFGTCNVNGDYLDIHPNELIVGEYMVDLIAYDKNNPTETKEFSLSLNIDTSPEISSINNDMIEYNSPTGIVDGEINFNWRDYCINEYDEDVKLAVEFGGDNCECNINGDNISYIPKDTLDGDEELVLSITNERDNTKKYIKLKINNINSFDNNYEHDGVISSTFSKVFDIKECFGIKNDNLIYNLEADGFDSKSFVAGNDLIFKPNLLTKKSNNIFLSAYNPVTKSKKYLKVKLNVNTMNVSSANDERYQLRA